MSKDINLAPHKRKEVLEKQKKLKIFRIMSISFFCGVLGITLIIILLNVFSPVGGLKKEKNSLKSKLSEYNSLIGKYAFVSSRTHDVSDILTKRSSYQEIMQKLIENLPNDVHIDSLKVSGGQINLIISSTSLSSLNLYFDSLVLLTDTSKIFQRVLLESLNSDSQKSIYNAAIVLDK